LADDDKSVIVDVVEAQQGVHNGIAKIVGVYSGPVPSICACGFHLEERGKDWEQETEAASGPRVRTHLVKVSFSMSADAEERAYFNQVPASLRLDDEEVDRLIEFGRRAFRVSPDTLRLLDTLGP